MFLKGRKLLWQEEMELDAKDNPGQK